MLIEGSLYVGNRLIDQHSSRCEDERPFHKKMEFCLLDICRSCNVPIPIWMPNNTRELGAFHQTVFSPEQFLEKVSFDRFVLRWLE